MTVHRLFVFGSLLLGLCSVTFAAEGTADGDRAERFNRELGRGINFGNVLEAPKEGEWGLTLKEEYFDKVKQAGFDSVRIPIRWSAHAERNEPYTVDPEFFRRVDWAVEQGLSRGLVVVINDHHNEDVYSDPAAEKPRFLALWKQISERYKDRPERLYFEILNEPHGKLDAATWNDLFGEALKIVRRTNPRRMVIVGPAMWNNPSQLPNLKLSEDDRNLIVTFHYYSPFEFTHQGASWAQGSDKWLGRTWTGTEKEQQAVRNDFDKVAQWAKQHNRPIYLGEFGAYSKADLDSRVRWTQFIREAAEQRHFSWAYWEFGSGFGAYDPASGTWRTPLLTALIPERK